MNSILQFFNDKVSTRSKLRMAFVLSVFGLLFCISPNNAFSQVKKVVLVEEGTGTWCQYCPRGDVYSRELHKKYPGKYIYLAYHVSDPMEVLPYSDSLPFTGLPNGWIDRNKIVSLFPFDSLDQDMALPLAEDPPASVGVTTSWNTDTRDLEINVSATMYQNLSGNFRLAVFVTEDGVTGSGPQYNQVNNYSGGDFGPMGGFEDLPNPIPASFVSYDHVVRALPGGLYGDTGSLPATLDSGKTYTYTYTYHVPADYDANYIRVAGVMLDANTGLALNAGQSSYLPGYDNAKPFFHSLPIETGYEGLEYKYSIIAHDPERDSLSISVVGTLPPGLTLTDLGGGLANLEGVPTETGVFPVTLQLSDGEWIVTQQWQLTITQAKEKWELVGTEGFNGFEAYTIDMEINPDNVPIVLATDGANSKVHVYKYEDEKWNEIGSGIDGDGFHTAMTLSKEGQPIVFSKGKVVQWNGTGWDQLGATFGGDLFIYNDIIRASDGTLYAVFFNSDYKTIIYRFDGSNWVKMGNVSDSNYAVWNKFSLQSDGEPMLIYGIDGQSIAYSEAKALENGQWDLLGSAHIEDSSQTYYYHDIAATSNGDIYAALTIGVADQALNIYKLDNGDWKLVKANLSGGATTYCRLGSDNKGNLIIAFSDALRDNRTSVIRYDGTEWKYLGNPGFTNVASIQTLAINHEGTPYVAYPDGAFGDKISVMKYIDLTSSTKTSKSANYHLLVYPNPVNNQVTLQTKNARTYQILNSMGEQVQSGKIDSGSAINGLVNQSIRLDDVMSGIYIIRVQGDSGIQSIKFFKL